MLISGEASPDDNMFSHLHDLLHPNVPNKENPMMELILDTIKAAGEDRTGDPLNAMVEYVLDHPKAAQNPIVNGAKLIHTTITDPDLHHTSPLIGTATHVMETLSNPNILEDSPVLKLVTDTLEDPSKMAGQSPLLDAATKVHKEMMGATDMASGKGIEGLTKMVSTFTKNMASADGEQKADMVANIIESHPAGKALASAAEVLQETLEDPEGSNDALLDHGKELFDTVTGEDKSTQDPIVHTAKTVYNTLSKIDTIEDPILDAAKDIHDHVMDGLDGLGLDDV